MKSQCQCKRIKLSFPNMSTFPIQFNATFHFQYSTFLHKQVYLEMNKRQAYQNTCQTNCQLRHQFSIRVGIFLSHLKN